MKCKCQLLLEVPSCQVPTNCLFTNFFCVNWSVCFNYMAVMMEVCQLYLLMVQHWIETPDKASRTGSMHDWNGQNLAWKQQMWVTKEIGESLLYTLRPRSAYIILPFFCLNDLKSRRSSDGQDWLSGWPLLAGIHQPSAPSWMARWY